MTPPTREFSEPKIRVPPREGEADLIGFNLIRVYGVRDDMYAASAIMSS
jgi:hypothetical protein